SGFWRAWLPWDRGRRRERMGVGGRDLVELARGHELPPQWTCRRRAVGGIGWSADRFRGRFVRWPDLDAGRHGNGSGNPGRRLQRRAVHRRGRGGHDHDIIGWPPLESEPGGEPDGLLRDHAWRPARGRGG